MGYLNVSSRIAVLSLGLLALASCKEAGQNSENNLVPLPDDGWSFVICPGDRRCGLMDEVALRPTTCKLKRTHYTFQCGPQARPCPGDGCPTGEPGLSVNACRVHEAFVEVDCPKTPATDPGAESAAPAAAAPAQPVPVPAEKAAE